MQGPATSSSPPPAPSFAGLLAALAAPKEVSEPLAWNDDRLAEDVATLSYERALRTHARYPPLDPEEPPMPQESAPPAADSVSQPPSEIESSTSLVPDRHLRCASITIRLNKEEDAQLRQRAAEAGLTVSAYLRSCTFEAETLRSLVKDTLAKLRAASAKESAPAPLRRGWLRRLFQRGIHTHARESPSQV